MSSIPTNRGVPSSNNRVPNNRQPLRRRQMLNWNFKFEFTANEVVSPYQPAQLLDKNQSSVEWCMLLINWVEKRKYGIRRFQQTEPQENDELLKRMKNKDKIEYEEFKSKLELRDFPVELQFFNCAVLDGLKSELEKAEKDALKPELIAKLEELKQLKFRNTYLDKLIYIILDEDKTRLVIFMQQRERINELMKQLENETLNWINNHPVSRNQNAEMNHLRDIRNRLGNNINSTYEYISNIDLEKARTFRELLNEQEIGTQLESDIKKYDLIAQKYAQLAELSEKEYERKLEERNRIKKERIERKENELREWKMKCGVVKIEEEQL